MVEAEGIEPSSENHSGRISTRVGTLFKVSGSPAAAGLRTQQAHFVSTLPRRQLGRSSLIVAVCRGYRRKPRTPSLPGFNQAARATALSFAVAGLPIFTWPWAPRRAIRTATSSSKPVRPLVKDESARERRLAATIADAAAVTPRRDQPWWKATRVAFRWRVGRRGHSLASSHSWRRFT